MNVTPTVPLLITMGVIPANDDTRQQLYSDAIDRLQLPLCDYLTIRDLRQFVDTNALAVDAFLLCLFAATNNGNVCVTMTRPYLEKRFADFVTDTTMSSRLATDVNDLIGRGVLAPIISDDGEGYVPLIRHRERVYFQKYFVAEKALQRLLIQRLTTDTVPMPPLTSSELSLPDIVARACHMPIGDGRVIALNDEQQLALMTALLKRFVIISGGPGTGKTSIIAAILQTMADCGLPAERMRLAAPTGRAAQRLTEAVQSHALALNRSAPDTPSAHILPTLRATTIHALLKYRSSQNEFTYHKYQQLPADVVIIDEVSMVDIVLMSALLDAIPPHAHLIMLGDRHQLPSVDAGAVLADLLPDHDLAFSDAFVAHASQLIPALRLPTPPTVETPITDHGVLLKKNYRSTPEILAIATAINTAPSREQDAEFAHSAANIIVDTIPVLPMPTARPLQWPLTLNDADETATSGGCWRIRRELDATDDGWNRVLQSWGTHHYITSVNTDGNTYLDCVRIASNLLSSTTPPTEAELHYHALFDFVTRARILCLLHAGSRGTVACNQHLARQLAAASGENDVLFPGAPIVIERNDASTDLFNGDVGVIIGDNQRRQAVFPRYGHFVTYPIDTLPPFQLAFAMTVHKSQGSEYDHVLLVLPHNAEHRLLTREIVYTALTRAKKLAVVDGTTDALKHAICSRKQRESGLELWADADPTDGNEAIG